MEDGQYKRLKDRMDESARSEILQQLDKFPYFDLERVTIHIKAGTPCEEIVKEAEEADIDLIVMPPPPSAGLAKFLSDRLARVVMKRANCQVLLSA